MRDQAKLAEQPLIDFIKGRIGLFMAGQSGQHCPRLGIQENLVFFILVRSEFFSGT